MTNPNRFNVTEGLHPEAPVRTGVFEVIGQVARRGKGIYTDPQHEHVLRQSGEFGMTEAREGKKKAVFEGLRQARELFRELDKKYGIKNAGFNPVLAANPAQGVGGLIHGNFVEGNSSLDVANMSGPERDAALRLLDRLTKYAVEKRISGEPYIEEAFALDQYTFQPDEGELIMHDTDPSVAGDGQFMEEVSLPDLEAWARPLLGEEGYQKWEDNLVRDLKPAWDQELGTAA